MNSRELRANKYEIDAKMEVCGGEDRWDRGRGSQSEPRTAHLSHPQAGKAGGRRTCPSSAAMAATRPVGRAIQNITSILRTSSTPRVSAGGSPYACGYCSQQMTHSTSSPTPPHVCPSTHAATAHSPVPSPTHSPARRINRRTELDFEELRALQTAGDIALIDVREEQELENYGGIPGSLNIPLCKIKTALQLSEDDWIRVYNIEKPNLDDRNLVFYARGPNASSTAVEIAHRLGFKRSRHYTGGWEDYCRKTGMPLKKNQQNDFSSYYPNNFDQFFL